MAGQLALETSEVLTTHAFGVWAGKGGGGQAVNGGDQPPGSQSADLIPPDR